MTVTIANRLRPGRFQEGRARLAGGSLPGEALRRPPGRPRRGGRGTPGPAPASGAPRPGRPGRPTGTRTAASPNVSSKTGRSATIDGVPRAAASSGVKPKPSSRDTHVTASAPEYSASSSSSETCPSRTAPDPSSLPRRGPSPAKTSSARSPSRARGGAPPRERSAACAARARRPPGSSRSGSRASPSTGSRGCARVPTAPFCVRSGSSSHARIAASRVASETHRTTSARCASRARRARRCHMRS